jgi:hypothetical protein
LKAAKEKCQVNYKGKSIRVTAGFSTETKKQGGNGMVYFKDCKKITAKVDYSTQENYHS